MECPFCKNNKERIFSESENVKVIFSDPRLTKGHLLVIPKRHVERTWELTVDEINEIFIFLKDLQKKISETIGTGCDIRQNYRPFMIQNHLKVDHIHFHLIPRTFEDEIYKKTQIFEKEVFQDLTEKEVHETKSFIIG